MGEWNEQASKYIFVYKKVNAEEVMGDAGDPGSTTKSGNFFIQLLL